MTHAPLLSDTQIRRIRRVAKVRQVKAEEILYQPGDETPPVYIVLSGGVKSSCISAGEKRTFTIYLEKQFSGDFLMISGGVDISVRGHFRWNIAGARTQGGRALLA